MFSYDGTNYSGYQKQINQLGIQTVIEKAFRLMTQIDIETFAASRTDKGVHAYIKYNILILILNYIQTMGRCKLWVKDTLTDIRS